MRVGARLDPGGAGDGVELAGLGEERRPGVELPAVLADRPADDRGQLGRDGGARRAAQLQWAAVRPNPDNGLSRRPLRGAMSS